MINVQRTALHCALLATLCASLHSSACAQQSPLAPAPTTGVPQTESLPIISGDTISLHILDDVELDQKNLRVTDSGVVPLLLIGPIRVTGLTPGEAANVIGKAYVDRHIIIHPDAQVTIEALSSSDVTVIGSVNGATGTITGAAFTLTTPRPLLTVLAIAGGLNDKASRTITIERRDPSKPRITVTLPVDANKDLDNNPLIYPGDTIVVPRAGYVYLLGNVSHAQAVVMNEDGNLTLLQAISQAGGALPNSSLKKVMIFRKSGDTYQPIPVNVGKILSGKAQDVHLEPLDAIYVPFSVGKNLLVNGSSITAALASAAATGLIYTH